MANGHGGHRTPAKPASVSGPGALSRRTDGGPGHPSQKLSAAPDQGYGEMTDQMNQQRIAPMAGKQPLPPAAAVAGGQGGGAPAQAPAYQGGDFAGPTARPHEPITNGVDIGAGAGPEALALPTPPTAAPTGYLTNLLQQMSATDTTGTLATLYQIAQQRGV